MTLIYADIALLPIAAVLILMGLDMLTAHDHKHQEQARARIRRARAGRARYYNAVSMDHSDETPTTAPGQVRYYNEINGQTAIDTETAVDHLQA